MKKIILLATGVCIIGILSTNAQSRVGAGFAYGTEIEEFGINLNGEFFLNNKVAVAPGFIFFFAEDPISWWELNANAHFYFVQSGAASLYGLAGINLATIGFDNGITDNSNTEFGLNLGIGSNFDINSAVIPFIQLRIVLGDADQAVLSFGVRFSLK